MAIVLPKIVSLDTATWNLLAEEQTPATDRIYRLFSSGDIVPFFMETVIMEHMGHGNDAKVERRITMLRRLPHVSFMQGRPGHASVGWLLDLREAEMAIIRDFPDARVEDVRECLRGQVANQFCSGAELCDRYYHEWMATREIALRVASEAPEIATLAQFSLPGVNLNQKIPSAAEDVEYLSVKEFNQLLAAQNKWLVNKYKTDGDKKIKEPEKAAAKFLLEICDDMEGILDGNEKDVTEVLLARAGVERSRLPPNPTIDDVGFESIFIGHLKIHERRLNLPQGTLKQFVRQNLVPSWIVWREVGRTIRQLPKAEASTLNDKMIMPFALYLDGVEVDKRIRHCIRKAAPSHPLMKIVDAHVFGRTKLDAFADQLKKIASS